MSVVELLVSYFEHVHPGWLKNSSNNIVNRALIRIGLYMES